METKTGGDYRDLAVYHESLRLRDTIRKTLAAPGICKNEDNAASKLLELIESLPRTIVSGWINDDSCVQSDYKTFR